jgi:DNA repair exonuclease SbcCD ATPase subunit
MDNDKLIAKARELIALQHYEEGAVPFAAREAMRKMADALATATAPKAPLTPEEAAILHGDTPTAPPAPADVAELVEEARAFPAERLLNKMADALARVAAERAASRQDFERAASKLTNALDDRNKWRDLHDAAITRAEQAEKEAAGYDAVIKETGDVVGYFGTALPGAIRKLKERAEQAERERDEWRRSCTTPWGALIRERDALRADLDAARAESDALREQNGMYRADLRDTRTALTDCAAQNNQMRAELEKVNQKIVAHGGEDDSLQHTGCRILIEVSGDDHRAIRRVLAPEVQS